MDADGDNKRPFKRRPKDSVGGIKSVVGSHPAWSPDGTRIAYQVCSNCEIGGKDWQIVTVETAGETFDQNQLRSIASHPASDTDPAWSSDGSRIVFSSGRDFFDADTLRFRKDLYMVNADGTGLKRLTETGNATRPVWSPDGNKIAYEWNIQGNEIFIYELSTDQIRNIETGLEFSGNPIWISTGTQLLVFGRNNKGSKPEMRLLNILREPAEIVMEIPLKKEALIGRNYNWVIPSNN